VFVDGMSSASFDAPGEVALIASLFSHVDLDVSKSRAICDDLALVLLATVGRMFHGPFRGTAHYFYRSRN